MGLTFGTAVDVFPRGTDFQGVWEKATQAITRDVFPGAVVLTARNGVLVDLTAVGFRQVVPRPQAMTADTVFDLASLTKCLFTAPAALWLWQEGLLDLDQPVGHYLPVLDTDALRAVTARRLLAHQSGLPASLYVPRSASLPDVLQQVRGLRVQVPPRIVYSDTGYLVLGALVERLSGSPLRQVAKELYRGSGSGLRFGPIPAVGVAATEQRGREVLVGVVHDEKARALGGAAGHAGLFGAALDVARWLEALRSGCGSRLTAPARRHLLGEAVCEAGDRRSLGFSLNAPTGFGPNAYGHTGFTGTSFWVDPADGLISVLLSNRVHPKRRPRDSIRDFREAFHEKVAALREERLQ